MSFVRRCLDKLVAYLALVRFPAVFTAVGDVLAGFACATGSFRPLGTVVALVASSSAIYLAGMALNDLFDRHRDAVDRPERPIPSGRVTALEAAVLSWTLLTIGVVAAWWCGPVAGTVALALAIFAVGYDAGLKSTWVGPVVMGTCRGLNVLLGAAGIQAWRALGGWPQAAAAASLATYVAGLTWIARAETDGYASEGQTARLSLRVGAVCAAVGLAGFGVMSAVHSSGRKSISVLLIVTVVAATVGRRLRDLLSRLEPPYVHRAVRTMIYSILVLDAAVVLLTTGRPDLGLLVLSLLVPHLGLQLWFRVT